MTIKFTPEIIIAAINGFESQKARIDDQIAELRAILDGAPSDTGPEAPAGKRKVSAAARRRMALGQKARWAKLKGGSETPAAATAEPSKPKRKLSEAGRAAIVAATKARWERVHAAAGKSKTAATKSAGTKAPAKRAAMRKSASKTAKKSATVGASSAHGA